MISATGVATSRSGSGALMNSPQSDLQDSGLNPVDFRWGSGQRMSGSSVGFVGNGEKSASKTSQDIRHHWADPAEEFRWGSGHMAVGVVGNGEMGVVYPVEPPATAEAMQPSEEMPCEIRSGIEPAAEFRWGSGQRMSATSVGFVGNGENAIRGRVAPAIQQHWEDPQWDFRWGSGQHMSGSAVGVVGNGEKTHRLARNVQQRWEDPATDFRWGSGEHMSGSAVGVVGNGQKAAPAVESTAAALADFTSDKVSWQEPAADFRWGSGSHMAGTAVGFARTQSSQAGWMPMDCRVPTSVRPSEASRMTNADCRRHERGIARR